MVKKSEGNKLEKMLAHDWTNVWEVLEKKELDIVKNLGEEYKTFLDKGKTEREVVSNIVKYAEENGYINLEKIIEKNIKVVPGTKIYANNKNKSAAMFVIGKEKLEKGMNIIASHVDSPRIDVKQFPLYEESQLGFLKTHYYGGVKKYQWVTLPLALHGVVIKSNGEKINITIGEDDNDPVFFITDLLPHLAKEQMEKKLSEAITGEGLNILFGSIPYKDSEINEKVKLNILDILYKKYGIVEEDFTTAELEIVPAGKARDVGIDRSMIGGYGQDDSVCVYTSLKAILDINAPIRTSVALFSDKEEVGSLGNTGMESRFFENAIAEIINLTEENYNELKLKRALLNSKVLSADTVGAFDPNYPDVLDRRNAPFLGNGICLVKYTGTRGKSSTNDANSEYISQVRKIFNENNIIWQMGELGKVDQGGGGTIAYILANYGAEVVDCGPALLSVHGPFEVSSKADVYMTYKAYRVFYKEM